jgi:hypothetical protein
MTTPYELTFNDETIADLIVDTMDNHHDMDVSFADHARHIVAALRDNGLLADAPLDVEGVRVEIDRLAAMGHRVFGTAFHFVTATIWGREHRGPNAGFAITLHIARNSKSFYARTPAEALRDAERYMVEHDPVRAEAEGWQILGVVRA